MPDLSAEIQEGREADWSLDDVAVRVQNVADGLLLDVDLVKARRGAVTGAVVTAAIGSAMLLFMTTFQRWFGLLFLGFAVATLFRKRAPDRCTVARDRIESTAKGGCVVEAAAVTEVVLERREVWRGSGKRRRRVTEWPVLLAGPDRFFANSGDRTRARRFAEDLALVLGKPFRDATGASDRVVPADAVNLGLLERLRRGILPADDPGPAPAGVRVRDAGGAREYAAPRRAWRKAANFAVPGFIVGGFGAFVLLTVLGTGADPPAPVLAVPVVFLGLGLLLLLGGVVALVGEDLACVTPEGVAHGIRRFGSGGSVVTPLDGLEDVRVMNGVHLVGDEVDVDLGFASLDADAQAWVARAILHDVARSRQ